MSAGDRKDPSDSGSHGKYPSSAFGRYGIWTAKMSLFFGGSDITCSGIWVCPSKNRRISGIDGSFARIFSNAFTKIKAIGGGRR